MHLANINILDLLPQRPPFIMVDKLIDFEPLSAKTIFEVRDDNLFCKNGIMEETGLIENIAQTCAACMGFRNIINNYDSEIFEKKEDNTSGQKSDKVRIGVIAIINSLEINRNPSVGEVLETLMTIEEEYFSTTSVLSEVKIGDEIIACCRMKLVLTDKMV